MSWTHILPDCQKLISLSSETLSQFPRFTSKFLRDDLVSRCHLSLSHTGMTCTTMPSDSRSWVFLRWVFSHLSFLTTESFRTGPSSHLLPYQTAIAEGLEQQEWGKMRGGRQREGKTAGGGKGSESCFPAQASYPSPILGNLSKHNNGKNFFAQHTHRLLVIP